MQGEGTGTLFQEVRSHLWDMFLPKQEYTTSQLL